MQNRAARVITGISYEDADHNRIRKDLDILNVRQLVELDRASLMYRVENDSVPAHFKNMFTKCSKIHAYITRAANVGNYATTKIRTEKGNKTFNRRFPKYGINCRTSSEGLSQLNHFKKKQKLF